MLVMIIIEIIITINIVLINLMGLIIDCIHSPREYSLESRELPEMGDNRSSYRLNY